MPFSCLMAGEAQYQDIDKLVASGLCDVDRACEILGVDVEAYRAYQSEER